MIDTIVYKGFYETSDGKKYYDEITGEEKHYFFKVGQHDYYSNEDGIIQIGDQKINGFNYYFLEDGKMFKGFRKIGNDLYYYGNGSGQLKYGFSYIGNDTYYSDNTGKVLTGDQTIDGYKYYFQEDGKMFKGFKELSDGNREYYNENDGKLNYGWVIISNDLYYSNELGVIVTGKVKIDSIEYNFSTDGKLEKNQTTPTYYMQTDSRWAKIRFGGKLFKSTGCAPTSMAMAFTGILNKTILPIDVGNYLYYNTNEYNHYTVGSSGLAIVYASNNYGVKYTPIKTKEELKIALLKGNIVFAAMGNGKFATEKWNHAIVLHQYSNNMAYAFDPLKVENNGWVSIDQLWNEQSIDPDDSRGGSNFYELK